MAEEKTDLRMFDIRGQICPSTLLVALREINRHRDALQDGSMGLLFITDNRDSTVTIPEAAENMGYRAEVRKVGHHYEVEIGRSS